MQTCVILRDGATFSLQTVGPQFNSERHWRLRHQCWRSPGAAEAQLHRHLHEQPKQGAYGQYAHKKTAYNQRNRG